MVHDGTDNGGEVLGDEGMIPVTRSTAVGVRSDAASSATEGNGDLRAPFGE